MARTEMIPGVGRPAAGEPPAYLRLSLGEKGSDLVPIPADTHVLLGRSAALCQVVADAPGVSRSHLSLSYHAATGTFLVTEHSANGTYWACGRRLPAHTSVEVPAGTTFYLGGQSVSLQLLVHAEEGL